MEAPDYTKYTIEELYDVRSKVNQDLYPDRYEIIINEIEKRKEMGEILIKASTNPFWKSRISISNAISIWWCYTWRLSISILLLYFLVGIVIGIVNNYIFIDKPTIKIITNITGIIGGSILGVIFIKQALSNRYQKFDIHIVEREKSNKQLNMDSGADAPPPVN